MHRYRATQVVGDDLAALAVLYIQIHQRVEAQNRAALIETAKANGLNPYDYLQHLFNELPQAQTLEQIETMLPWIVPLG